MPGTQTCPVEKPGGPTIRRVYKEAIQDIIGKTVKITSKPVEKGNRADQVVLCLPGQPTALLDLQVVYVVLK